MRLVHISFAVHSFVLQFLVAFVVGVRSKPWVCCLGLAFLVPLAASSWRRYCCGFYVPWSPSWPGGRSNPAQFFVGVPQFIASQLWLVGASPSVSVPSLLGITAKGGVPCRQTFGARAQLCSVSRPRVCRRLLVFTCLSRPPRSVAQLLALSLCTFALRPSLRFCPCLIVVGVFILGLCLF